MQWSKFVGQACLITGIENQMKFNRHMGISIVSGHQMVAFGYQMDHSDEVSVPPLPDMDMLFDNGDGEADVINNTMGDDQSGEWPSPKTENSQWVTIRDADIDGLAKTHHLADTAHQTKWSLIRGVTLILLELCRAYFLAILVHFF